MKAELTVYRIFHQGYLFNLAKMVNRKWDFQDFHFIINDYVF